MSPQPTQAHLDKATCWIVKRPLNVSHQIDSLAQLIADSEARAVEAATKQLRSELNYAKASEELYHDEGTQLREKVRVLREALENLRDEQNGAPLCTRESEWKDAMDKADAALAATKEELS